MLGVLLKGYLQKSTYPYFTLKTKNVSILIYHSGTVLVTKVVRAQTQQNRECFLLHFSELKISTLTPTPLSASIETCAKRQCNSFFSDAITSPDKVSNFSLSSQLLFYLLLRQIYQPSVQPGLKSNAKKKTKQKKNRAFSTQSGSSQHSTSSWRRMYTAVIHNWKKKTCAPNNPCPTAP